MAIMRGSPGSQGARSNWRVENLQEPTRDVLQLQDALERAVDVAKWQVFGAHQPQIKEFPGWVEGVTEERCSNRQYNHEFRSIEGIREGCFRSIASSTKSL